MNVNVLQRGAFADSQSTFWVFTAVAEKVSRIMAPEEQSAKTFYSVLNDCSKHKSLQLYRMCNFLLPVYICQCDTLQRHLQVDDGCSEGSRGLEGGRDRLLHCTGPCQHLSGDGV